MGNTDTAVDPRIVAWGVRPKLAEQYRALYYTPLTSVEVDVRQHTERLALLQSLNAPAYVTDPVKARLDDFKRVAQLIRDGKQDVVDAEYGEKKRYLRSLVVCRWGGYGDGSHLCTPVCEAELRAAGKLK